MQNTLIKKVFTGAALTCCLLAAWFLPRWAYSHWQATNARRVVSVDTPRFNFGVVEPGTVISNRFRMTNGTSHRINILKVLTSCACTVADLPKPNLAPGESIDISVRMDTSGRYGSLVKDVSVVTDDPNYGVLRLLLAGEVRMLFSPPSKTLDLAFMKDQEAVQEFWITVAGKARNASLQLRQQSIPDYLQLSLKRTSDNAILVRVSLKPDKAPDKFNAKVFLDPDDSTLPAYPIFIEGQVQSRFSWAPRKLYLGIVRPGELVQRRLTVWANGDYRSPVPASNLSFTSQPSPSCQVTTEVATPSPNRWDVDCKFLVSSNLRAGDKVTGQVLIEDDRPCRMEIPIEGFVATATP
jgi:hypothetical protein